MYNGYELCEGTPVPGKEEFLNSEKYQYKVWDWNRPGNIKGFIRRINEIRRDNRALHHLKNLVFHHSNSRAISTLGAVTTSDRLAGTGKLVGQEVCKHDGQMY
jgi:starch synthase (maltosyl-transferring)